MTRFVTVLAVLLMFAGPALAQFNDRSRAREQCLDEADRQGIRVLSAGGARERRDYQDRLQDTTVMLEIEYRGRIITARCVVRVTSAEAIIELPDRNSDRRPEFAVPSLRSTQDRCERAANREGFRVERVLRQEDLFSRGRVTGRETTLAVRRNDRRGGLICTFDFRADRMTVEFYRR